MAKKGDGTRIVVKKKRQKGHGGHHGGAWKVAYADFVTAMMAFFLLLWLLNATTEQQLYGIANYFSPTSVTKTNSGGGGVLNGQTLAREGALTDNRAPMGLRMDMPSNEIVETPGDSPAEQRAEGNGANDTGEDRDPEAYREALEKLERERFDKAEVELRQAIQSSPDLKELMPHLVIDRTEEGMRIQIVDSEGSSMFPRGAAEPYPRTRQLLAKVAHAIADLPNEIAIKGHTDSVPYPGDADYTNWELSADRANASRRVLTGAGLPSDRIASVVGRADQEPLLPDDTAHPRNRRISIILLRRHPATFRTETQAPRRNESEQKGELRLGPSIAEPGEQSG